MPFPPAKIVESPQDVGPTPMTVRLCAAVPHLVAAAVLSAIFGDYIGGEIRITGRVHDASAWLMYELLACVYMSLLPLGMVFVSLARVVLTHASLKGLRDGSVLLVLPFVYLAWSLSPDGAAGWGLLAFLVLAFARWVPYRHEAALLGGILGVARGAWRAVRVWGFFTAAFLLSALLILPLEPLLGLEMPSVEHGQYFLFLGMGIIYFALNAVFELFDLNRKLFPPHRRLRNPFRPVFEDPRADVNAGAAAPSRPRHPREVSAASTRRPSSAPFP